jgi:hypothetical protein
MQKLFIIVFLFSVTYIYAEKRMITQEETKQVYRIAERKGVPLSVARQLMTEESGGDCHARSHLTAEGFYSRGLYQLYTRPDYLAWMLSKYWTSDKPFDIENPIDNSQVAMAYLSSLHDRFGNWLQACIYFNHGSIYGYSKSTKAYAKRIINAE